MNKQQEQRNGARIFLVFSIITLVASCASRPQHSVVQDTKPAEMIKEVPAQPVAKKTAVAVKPVAKKPVTQKPVAKAAPVPAPVPTKPELAKPAPVETRVAKTPPPAKPEPVAPPPPPPTTTSDVLGLGPVKVTRLLGEPRLVRREKPAEVWQYSGDGCVLHVFLYDDQTSASVRVDHLEATDLQGARASTDNCLAGLVR